MQTQSLQTELRDFLQFASTRVETGNDGVSLEELVRQWRLATEYAQAVGDVRQGITDAAQGLAKPIADVFLDVRQKLGIVD